MITITFVLLVLILKSECDPTFKIITFCILLIHALCYDSLVIENLFEIKKLKDKLE